TPRASRPAPAAPCARTWARAERAAPRSAGPWRCRRRPWGHYRPCAEFSPAEPPARAAARPAREPRGSARPPIDSARAAPLASARLRPRRPGRHLTGGVMIRKIAAAALLLTLISASGAWALSKGTSMFAVELTDGRADFADISAFGAA